MSGQEKSKYAEFDCSSCFQRKDIEDKRKNKWGKDICTKCKKKEEENPINPICKCGREKGMYQRWHNFKPQYYYMCKKCEK